LPGVYYLRTLDAAAAIAAEASPGKRAVLMGAGFIGMEVAASLTQRGVHVTVIEAQPHIWPRFANATLAGFFQDYCVKKGVTFHTNDLVTEIRGQGRPPPSSLERARNSPATLSASPSASFPMWNWPNGLA
jgi:3-phenylpropionate/trans-cinnamate dioxygenase ferredoxin reductase subunit